MNQEVRHGEPDLAAHPSRRARDLVGGAPEREMSKTDKTKPWRVRINEHNPRPDHDHRDGVCNLPVSPLVDHAWSAGNCTWQDFRLIYDGGCCHGCGCHICTAYWWRRQERRRSRHQAQRFTQALRTGSVEW